MAVAGPLRLPRSRPSALPTPPRLQSGPPYPAGRPPSRGHQESTPLIPVRGAIMGHGHRIGTFGSGRLAGLLSCRPVRLRPGPAGDPRSDPGTRTAGGSGDPGLGLRPSGGGGGGTGGPSLRAAAAPSGAGPVRPHREEDRDRRV